MVAGAIAAAVPVGAPQAAVDLGRVRAVIETLPEAVFVTESDGSLSLTNPAADRLFAEQPVRDRADLLSRFEEVAPERPRGRPLPARSDDRRAMTVRPRHQPNRWFALRSVPLEIEETALPPDPVAPSPTPASAPVADSDPLAAAPTVEGSPVIAGTGLGAHHDPPSHTAFVLRDVTDTSDLRPIREAFLSVLSHELRTPITTIYAGSSVLARRPTLSPPATRALARDISSEAARLYDLVEDLLVLARLERRVLEPLDEPVLVQRAVGATVRLAHERVADAPIEVRADEDLPPIHGDATYVEQACRNLLFPSLRYAGPGPERAVIIQMTADTAAGEVRVTVLDRGPTLSAEDLERAFELPDPAAVGRLAGTGVSPFVCRNLVEAMGGRVWARNRPNGGLETGLALRVDERG